MHKEIVDSYLDNMHLPDFAVQIGVDVSHVEDGILLNLRQQLVGEVGDGVAGKVPLSKDAGRDRGRGVGVATLAEVLAQVLAVAQTLEKTYDAI